MVKACLLCPSFGVVFDRKLLQDAYVHYIQQKCLGSTPGCDVDFVQGTDSFRFGVWLHSIAFDRMAATHMLKLKRIQYRCLTIALGLMQSTHVKTLEVIGGVPPLRLRFSMLNHKYLISAFSTDGHPFRRLLVALSRLSSTKMSREFGMVGHYDLEPAR
jgi:hypothetical protein